MKQKQRVPQGEKYWIIDIDGEIWYRDNNDGVMDDKLYETGNYFHTKEDAELMAKKLRAVLKGADVIEMPSESEIEKEALENNYIHKERGDCNYPDDLCVEIFKDGINYLKSKIVK